MEENEALSIEKLQTSCPVSLTFAAPAASMEETSATSIEKLQTSSPLQLWETPLQVKIFYYSKAIVCGQGHLAYKVATVKGKLDQCPRRVTVTYTKLIYEYLLNSIL